ncbi:MAG: zinc ribbon domain-containing protein [Bacillota bacterium]|jgi:putative FmdB family regulatory protein|nr:zinc ribbon domain-containing protein [Bacillota bacterium]HHT90474.1 zinc ribbon domain-containing protein [Bacillota bacterium]
MPIYEYKCSKCGPFEQKQSMKDDPLTHCPTCDGPVQRLISRSVGIVFKGPGFYINDSKSDSSHSKDTSAS